MEQWFNHCNYRKFFSRKLSVSHLGLDQKCCPRKEWSIQNGWKGWRRRKRRNWRLPRKRPPSLRQKRHALRLLPPSSASQRTENRRRKNASLDVLLWMLHPGQVRSLTSFLHWFIMCLIDWLTLWMHWLIDWRLNASIDWLISDLLDCLVVTYSLSFRSFRTRPEIRGGRILRSRADHRGKSTHWKNLLFGQVVGMGIQIQHVGASIECKNGSSRRQGLHQGIWVKENESSIHFLAFLR